MSMFGVKTPVPLSPNILLTSCRLAPIPKVRYLPQESNIHVFLVLVVIGHPVKGKRRMCAPGGIGGLPLYSNDSNYGYDFWRSYNDRGRNIAAIL